MNIIYSTIIDCLFCSSFKDNHATGVWFGQRRLTTGQFWSFVFGDSLSQWVAKLLPDSRSMRTLSFSGWNMLKPCHLCPLLDWHGLIDLYQDGETCDRAAPSVTAWNWGWVSEWNAEVIQLIEILKKTNLNSLNTLTPLAIRRSPLVCSM